MGNRLSLLPLWMTRTVPKPSASRAPWVLMCKDHLLAAFLVAVAAKEALAAAAKEASILVAVALDIDCNVEPAAGLCEALGGLGR